MVTTNFVPLFTVPEYIDEYWVVVGDTLLVDENPPIITFPPVIEKTPSWFIGISSLFDPAKIVIFPPDMKISPLASIPSSFDVKVNQAIIFYNVLGGDKELLGDKKEFEEKEERGEEGGEEGGEERGEGNQNLNIVPKKKKNKKKFY